MSQSLTRNPRAAGRRACRNVSSPACKSRIQESLSRIARPSLVDKDNRCGYLIGAPPECISSGLKRIEASNIQRVARRCCRLSSWSPSDSVGDREGLMSGLATVHHLAQKKFRGNLLKELRPVLSNAFCSAMKRPFAQEAFERLRVRLHQWRVVCSPPFVMH